MGKGYRIAAIPGDGIGPEVLEVAIDVLTTAVQRVGETRLTFDFFPWGSDYYLTNGRMMPADALEKLSQYDAILLGAIGDSRVPDHISLGMLLDIRQGFDQYVNLRPVKLLRGVHCPITLKPGTVIDFVVVRENTEGEYSRIGGRFKPHEDDEVAVQTSIFTHKGTMRVMRYAFELALRRSRERTVETGYPRPMVTNCTKSNALNYSMVFWDEIYDRVASDYPDVHRDKALVDALAMWLVRQPDYYDVIVASNLFGDIITDLGAAIQGGMGLAAGANINPERKYPSMFEPIHGSAPKYKGMNKVNPMAATWAGSMMLEHLGDNVTSRYLMMSIEKVLEEGRSLTYDLGGHSSTTEVGEALKKALQRFT